MRKKEILVFIVLLILFIEAYNVISEDNLIPQSGQNSIPSYTPEEIQTMQTVRQIYGNNLRCTDEDNGLNFETKSNTKQFVEANIIQRLLFLIRRISSGISSEELENAAEKRDGIDSCRTIGPERSDSYNINTALQTYRDKLWLTELYCEGNEVKRVTHECANGCNNGRCINDGEDIKPERYINWLVLTEDTWGFNNDLNIPVGLIFVKTQEEYNNLLDPYTGSPDIRKLPEFYTKYPIFKINYIDKNGTLNLLIENLNTGSVKLELQETITIDNLYQIKNTGDGIVVKYLGVREAVTMPESEK